MTSLWTLVRASKHGTLVSSADDGWITQRTWANFSFRLARPLYVTKSDRYIFHFHIEMHFIRIHQLFAELSAKNVRTGNDELTVGACHLDYSTNTISMGILTWASKAWCNVHWKCYFLAWYYSNPSTGTMNTPINRSQITIGWAQLCTLVDAGCANTLCTTLNFHIGTEVHQSCMRAHALGSEHWST